MLDDLRVNDCLRKFDHLVLDIMQKAADEAANHDMVHYNDMITYITDRLPDQYRKLTSDCLTSAIIISMVRLSDLGMVSENCAVSKQPHRCVPEAHLPDEEKFPIEKLPELERWLYNQINENGFSPEADNSFSLLAERLPANLAQNIYYPTDELGRAWMRLYGNGYLGRPSILVEIDAVRA